MAAANTQTLEDVVSDDLNYEIWAPIVKATVVEKGLWDVVENGIPPDPSNFPDGEIVWEKTRKRSRFCRKTLEVASAKDVWDLLKESNEQAKLDKEFEQIRIEQAKSDPKSGLADAKSCFLGMTKLVVSLSDSYYGAGIAPVMEELVVLQNLTFINLGELLDTFESVPVEVGYPSDDEVVTKMLISLPDSYYGSGKAPVMGPQILTFNRFRDLFESTPVETINVILKGLEVKPSSQSKEDSTRSKA